MEKATFPSLPIFVDLPSVQQHLRPEQLDGYTIDQELWLASLDDILADVTQRKKEEKARYFVKMARPLLTAKVPIPNLEQLVQKAESEWDPATKRNTPPTITEDEMDSFFAHPLARLLCSRGVNCMSSYAYPEIRLHEHSQHGGNYNISFGSSKWIVAVRKMIEQAGLDENRFEEKQLEALGEVWECRGCKVEGIRAFTPWGQPQVPVVPVQKTKLTWSRLVSRFDSTPSAS